MNGLQLNNKMEESIRNLLERILKDSVKNPSQAAFILKMMKSQKDAAKRREKNESKDLHIPAFMIASITKQCNLRCSGCYSAVNHEKHSGETDFPRLKSLVGEARDLGISIILLAGGEPLVRKYEILDIVKSHKDILFPIFTNGLLIDEAMMEDLNKYKNAVPVVSIEGQAAETDGRRGQGVYDKIKVLHKKLNDKGIFFGSSITVTSENYEKVTSTEFVDGLVKDGCKLFFFVEYVPVEAGTDQLVLSDSQKEEMMQRINNLRDSFAAAFIAFPGDEEAFGGCIASGRGFIHVNPVGDVEPCPFAPYSDSNIKDKSLAECIKSNFLKKIRENHSLLVENQGGGCALWQNREIVESYLRG